MPTADNDTLLIFRIATIACAVPAQSVDTIVMPPEHLTHPPGTGRSTPGIFRHSGQVHAVIDLHARFGIDTPRQGAGRLLLNHDSGRHHAFWVDEVVGLVRSEQGQWAPLPPYLPRDLFWSGFLYRKEIVLCTRLDDLLRMRDASPLHLHLAALQPKEEPAEVETGDDVPREAAPAPPSPAPGHDSPAAPPLANSAGTPSPRTTASAHHSAAVSPARPSSPPPARPASVRPSPPPLPTAASKESSTKPQAQIRTQQALAARKPPGQQRPVTPGNTSPTPRAAKSVPPAAGVRPVSSPTERPAATPSPPGRWLALLVLLGLGAGGGYWLWHSVFANTGNALRPITMEPLPPATAVDTGRVVSAQMPAGSTASLTASPAPQPAVAASTVRPIDTASGQQAGQALRIERDSEGTINLIIDRAAIQAQATPPVTSTVAVKQDVPPDAESQRSASAGESETESPATETMPEPAEEESPLQPDADWPAPIPATVEPCDCTHIVTKGDTLWDIAEHYTQNAYNYHDLARRSGIRNPDRIYPGNRVRIIIR